MFKIESKHGKHIMIMVLDVLIAIRKLQQKIHIIKKGELKMKRFVSIIMLLVLAVGTLTGCDSKSVKPPLTAEYCIGKDYELVESSFSGSGFTNISITALEDLEIN